MPGMTSKAEKMKHLGLSVICFKGNHFVITDTGIIPIEKFLKLWRMRRHI